MTWVQEYILAFGMVYGALLAIGISAAFLFWLFKVLDVGQPQPPRDFQPTRMYGYDEPKLVRSKDWWYCVGYLEGDRIVGKGKTQQRARESYERRLDKVLAESAVSDSQQ